MNSQQFQELKNTALSFRTESAKERLARLKKITVWIKSHQEEIIEALQKDFKKPRFESIISEIAPVLEDIQHTSQHLKKWMKDKCVSTPSTLFGHSSRIRYENKGVVLIISPWNYPFQLALSPLIPTLAAGNTAVIKPSELTPHTSALIKRLIEDCFPANQVLVELGAKEKTEELMSYNFDHVFFTGSTQVGRIIAKSCAERLIPVTLELGGKSPTIIDETADLDEAAEKIFWGKYINRGQSCIAPDYILVHESVATTFTQKLRLLADSNAASDKALIISERHHQRLQKLARTDRDLNAQTLEVLEIESTSHSIMSEEVFGPVMPVLRYRQLSDLKNLIDTKEKPLALYVFSKKQDNIKWILNNFTSGGVGINSVLMHFANHNLPFGGIGQSGAGRYHGHYGFLELSHQRAVIEQRFLSVTRKLVLPPYTPFKYKLLSWLK
ncbi:aldehyde dehydrogenase family protein [Pseudobdellovibrio exovorus]|uniref:Aldehyde dehydrogenase n=1 Tax=Pseudobdellovibrio exovorus JSS TaxID=1184267 RepID=M4VAN4_9BACT|nr:aldehyde dehydrogenase family protein [Pseudobdellovibrio exovorus]AGH95515.1 hypothetical protein A11Q_1299 [Pseudobdellovibrio exovorus JSS]